MDLILCMKNKKDLFGYNGNGDFDLFKNTSKYKKLIFSNTPNLFLPVYKSLIQRF